MKKAIKIIGFLIFAFVVIIPLLIIISDIFNYSFELCNYTVYALICACLCMAEVILCIVYRSYYKHEAEAGKAISVFFALASPFSVVCAVICVLKCGNITIVAAMSVCVGECVYLAVVHAGDTLIKLISLALCFLLVVPAGFICFFALIFADFGSNTLMMSLDSPNGKYCAEVIYADEGALGGDFIINARENRELDAKLFSLSKKPQRIYFGKLLDEGDIHWEDNSSLSVKGEKYEIR